MSDTLLDRPADLARSRLVEWHDANDAQRLMAGLTGLQIMQGIRDKRLPAPPMARLIGFDCVLAEEGRIIMRLDTPDESLLNPAGLVHGGTAATMLDTAMGAASHTVLPLGQAAVTLDLKLTYLRPLTVRSGPVEAEARVINITPRTLYVEGWVRDGKGRLAVHATGVFMPIGEKA